MWHTLYDRLVNWVIDILDLIGTKVLVWFHKRHLKRYCWMDDCPTCGWYETHIFGGSNRRQPQPLPKADLR